MACTTILVGKKASYDGSTMIARNDDSGSGHFTPKKFVVIHPEEQPKTYKSVISHVTIELPDDPMRYTAVPNAVEGEGIWAAAGVNEANVAMTATETITSNPRVLGADPLVEIQPAEDGKEEVPGGIGEEDIVCIVLPYIRSAREGVKRLGSLLEQYGTYEMNGIAFQDQDEIWWLETIGGHHWIARRVPDDVYVVMPNQLGIDHFDLEDALSDQKEYMCSSDLKEFIDKKFFVIRICEFDDNKFDFHIENKKRAIGCNKYNYFLYPDMQLKNYNDKQNIFFLNEFCYQDSIILTTDGKDYVMQNFNRPELYKLEDYRFVWNNQYNIEQLPDMVK